MEQVLFLMFKFQEIKIFKFTQGFTDTFCLKELDKHEVFKTNEE